MTNLPEDELRDPEIWPRDDPASLGAPEASPSAAQQPVEFSSIEVEPAAPGETEPGIVQYAPPSTEPPLFQSWTQPEVRPSTRIPNFGHLCLLLLLACIGFACAVVCLFLAMQLHLFGLGPSTASVTDVRLILATEGVLYLVTFVISLFVFPLFWNEGFFAGIQWRGEAALHRFWPLAAAAGGCIALALLDEILIPSPPNAPIEQMMRAPGAAWLMFGFGVTIAPFFEEMFFRGFLLPALCTAWDWAIERSTGKLAPPLDANGHPQWSLFAMIIASVLTSVPFALLHVEQQGHSLGPFLLLILVSLVLCTVRLKTRSLASSTLVHACYNFFIFSLAMIGTGGFRHFDKM
jgi:membrane protease YdiL (CAAX protease family)